MWNRLLIFFRLRPDFANDPEWTPPAFDSVPHVYDPEINGKTLTYCAECGGGRRHSIHVDVAEVIGNPPYPMTGRAKYPRPEQKEV